MPRYWGWDYKRPYYTMVTLRRREGLRLAFSVLDATCRGGLRPHPLTQALTRELFRLEATGRDVGSLKPFVIMPDHIHLLSVCGAAASPCRSMSASSGSACKRSAGSLRMRAAPSSNATGTTSSSPAAANSAASSTTSSPIPAKPTSAGPTPTASDCPPTSPTGVWATPRSAPKATSPC